MNLRSRHCPRLGHIALSVVALACSKLSSLALPYSASNHFFLLWFFLSGADVVDALDGAMSLISRLTVILLLLLSFLLFPNARAQIQAGVEQFLSPPTMPLAVRSPYLNCWLQYNQSFMASFGHSWPTTFNHSQVFHPHIFYWL